jgi:hypothetical protein
MSALAREETKLLIARQIAIHEGYTWQLHPSAGQLKKQCRYLTLAENILATVERKMADWRWKQ